MDQLKSKKIKPCVVKVARCNVIDPEIIRDRILDNRTRNCKVIMRRFDMSKFLNNSACGVYGQYKVRPCRVRLPKLNLDILDARSSPSVLPESDIGSESGRENESI